MQLVMKRKTRQIVNSQKIQNKNYRKKLVKLLTVKNFKTKNKRKKLVKLLNVKNFKSWNTLNRVQIQRGFVDSIYYVARKKILLLQDTSHNTGDLKFEQQVVI